MSASHAHRLPHGLNSDRPRADRGRHRPLAQGWDASGLVKAIALLEFIWAAVSLLVGRELSIPTWLPLSYLIYFGGMTTVGAILRERVVQQGVPRPTIIIGGVFGLYFAAASAFVVVLD